MDFDQKISSLELNTLGENYKNTFPFSFFIQPETNFLFSSLSNNYISIFDLNKGNFNLINSIMPHTKRINEIFVHENVLFSCSNDFTVTLWDLNSNKLIKNFKKTPFEVFSISKSKHILVGGIEGKIVFWDLKVMKERAVFEDSHNDDVTKVKFNDNVSTILLAGSIDGILALYDLGKENEEDSIQTMIRMDQPINNIGFVGNNCFTSSTIDSISYVNLEESKVIYTLNTIKNNEFNENYLIETFYDKNNDSVNYYLGNKKGWIEEIISSKNPIILNKINILPNQIVRCVKKLEENNILIGLEEGIISFSKSTPHYKQNEIFDMESEANQLYIEEEIMDNNTNKKKNKKNFNPFF